MNKKSIDRTVEFRSTEQDSDGRTLTGYGAVFNQDTQISSRAEGVFTERIQRGAFKKTLAESKPILQWDHGKDSRVGTTPIGHIIELREDAQGLYVEARLHDNPVVEPVRQAIESGAISGMSFRFIVVQEVWRDKRGNIVSDDRRDRMMQSGNLTRTITEVRLAELGPVAFPAYTGTSVGVRSGATPFKLIAAERSLDLLGL